jgi:hypothetical protein
VVSTSDVIGFACGLEALQALPLPPTVAPLTLLLLLLRCFICC